jgi:hypothetical protein
MLTSLKPKYNIYLDHNSPFWQHTLEVLGGLFNETTALIIVRSPQTESWPSFDCLIDITNKNEAKLVCTTDKYYISEDDYHIYGYADVAFMVGGEMFYKANDDELFEMISGKIKLK